MSHEIFVYTVGIIGLISLFYLLVNALTQLIDKRIEKKMKNERR
jgi:hypothetical protein